MYSIRHFIFLGIFAFISVSVADAQSLKKIAGITRTPTYVIETGNEYIRAIIEKDYGRFYILTADRKNILFGDSSRADYFTSHLIIKIDDQIYSNDDKLSKTAATSRLSGITSITNDCVEIAYSIPEKRTVVIQRITPVKIAGLGGALLECFIKNNDLIPHNIGLIYEFDTQIDKNDGSPFRTNIGLVSKETSFVNPGIPIYWRALEKNSSDSGVIGHGYLKGTFDFRNNSNDILSSELVSPDFVFFADWEKLNNVLWEYNAKTGDPYFDSGILLKWDQRSIPPNNTVSLSTYIGKGESLFEGVLTTSITIPGITFTGKQYSPNPFEVNLLVQNTGNDKVSNISADIRIPSDLELIAENRLINSPTVDLLPSQTTVFSYKVKAKFQTDTVVLPIELSLFTTNQTVSKFYRDVKIPAAPGVDFFKPVIESYQKYCTYQITVKDTQKYDRGIDTIVVDSSDNSETIFTNFSKGSHEIKLVCSLKDNDKPGFALIRAVDLDGNYEMIKINISSNLIGFDSLSEVVRSKHLVIPLKIYSLLKNEIDTNYSFSVKYDSSFLEPLTTPITLDNSQSEKYRIEKLEIKDQKISFKATGNSLFHSGTLCYLNFNIKSKSIDTTNLILENFVLNNENNCVNTRNSKVIISKVDTVPPGVVINQRTNIFQCRTFDTSKNSKGIYSVFLSNSNNAKTSISQFEPGVQELEFLVQSIDSTKTMTTILNIIDGAGNATIKNLRINPVTIEADTLRGKIQDIVKISPKITINPLDSLVNSYEFNLKYDSNVIKPIKPFLTIDSTQSDGYSVELDTSKSGTIHLKSSGKKYLKSGVLINIFFQIQPGNDNVSPVSFNDFLLNSGEKSVIAKNSALIRIKQDNNPPSIVTEQTGRKILIKVIDWFPNDLGIEKIIFSEIINFPSEIVPLFQTGNYYKYFEVEMLDSTKIASLVITAIDIATNVTTKKIEIIPIILSISDSIKGSINEKLTIPVKIANYQNLPVQKLKFSIRFDPNYIVFSDTPFSAKGTLLENVKITYLKTFNSISFDINLSAPLNKNKEELLFLNIKVKEKISKFSAIELLNLSANDNDSLLIYGISGKIIETKTDMNPPEILISQVGCKLSVKILETKSGDSKIKKIWIDSLINFNDSIIFNPMFSPLDSIANFTLYPINAKLKSNAIIFAVDNNGNTVKANVEIKPISLKFPDRTTISPNGKIKIPVYIDGYESQDIRNIHLSIKYDNKIMVPDSSSIDINNTYLQNSYIKINQIDSNIMDLAIKPYSILSKNTLLYLNFVGINGDSASGNISFSEYSFNDDSLCVNTSLGEIVRTKTDTTIIFVSIDSTLKGKIGSVVSIPIKIFGSNSELNITSYKMSLSYNGTLLSLSSINTKNSMSENSDIFNVTKDFGIFSFESKSKVYTNNSTTLISINAKIFLGTEYSTLIRINNLEINYDTLKIKNRLLFKPINGFFVLDSLYEWQKGLKLKGNYLSQNHPNPYNSTTNIIYKIEKSGIVKLLIYDVLGRIISEPINKYHESGIYNFSFSADNLPSGIYFYRIMMDNYSSIKKMILLR